MVLHLLHLFFVLRAKVVWHGENHTSHNVSFTLEDLQTTIIIVVQKEHMQMCSHTPRWRVRQTYKCSSIKNQGERIQFPMQGTSVTYNDNQIRLKRSTRLRSMRLKRSIRLRRSMRRRFIWLRSIRLVLYCWRLVFVSRPLLRLSFSDFGSFLSASFRTGLTQRINTGQDSANTAMPDKSDAS